MIRSRATPRSTAASTADRSQPTTVCEDAGGVARLLLVVHQHEVRIGLGRGDGRARIPGRRPDVVHDARAGIQCRARHGALGRIDADQRAVADRLGHRPDDRDREGGLRRLVDRRPIAIGGPRPRRLGADVEDLGAGGDERDGLLHGRGDDLVDPAVRRRQPVAGERVGRHVQDAHHPRPLAPGQPHQLSSPLPVSMPRIAPTR